MPCDFVPTPIVRTALDQLEEDIAAGYVTLAVSSVTGELTFLNWEEEARAGLMDCCVFQQMQQRNSMAFQVALAEAQVLAGREVNTAAMGG